MKTYNRSMKNNYKRPPTRYNLQMRSKKICKAISPTQFYREELVHFVPTRADGCNLVGYCPFHPGLLGDSFKVNLKYGSYECQYCSKLGSNIVDFYRHYHGVSLQKAVEDLEKRLGKKKRSK